MKRIMNYETTLDVVNYEFCTFVLFNKQISKKE